MRRWNRQVLMRAGVASCAITLAAIILLADTGSSNRENPDSVPTRNAVLRQFEELSRGQRVYWAGMPARGMSIEVTSLDDDVIEVGYPSRSVSGIGTAETGEGLRHWLIVRSRPLPDAMGTLEKLAVEPSSTKRRASARGLVVQSGKSAYFASPDGSVLVEVYDPASEQAAKLAVSGRIRPVH
jgi:hypothetical protein